MRTLQLHFTNQQQPDHPLQPGLQRIVRHASGAVRVGDDSVGPLLLAQLCMDGRGLWLQVVAGTRGVHVNGRPVRRMALLRAGDAVYIDGVELLVRGECQALQVPPSAPDQQASEDLRIILRGIGGPHHGRGFSIGRRLLVGSAPGADVVIDDPAFALQHAAIERHGEQVLLRDLGSADGTMVNGQLTHHCWLQPGDQVVFDPRHRFVLEDPVRARADLAMAHEEAPQEDAAALVAEVELPAPVRRSTRWPWLLLAAMLLAAALGSLLLFGAR